METCGPFTVRVGRSGGKRVSAASTSGVPGEAEVRAAEHRMKEIGQYPLFMVRGAQPEFDALLELLGYDLVDPVVVFKIIQGAA